MSDLVSRLLKRAQEDQTCADNSAVVAEALSKQMRLFEAREGHNIYAVRLAVDHQNSVKRDGQYASDLREAAAEITRLQKELETAREALEPFANRAGKLDGLWGGNDTNWSPAYGDTAITIGDLRRASYVYRALKDKEVAG